MSLRARLFSLVLRLTVRKQFNNASDYKTLRESFSSSGPLSAVPDRVSVIPLVIDDVPCEWISLDSVDQNRLLVYFHGGGYVVGGLDSHRDIAWRLAEASGRRVLLVDYRLAPENIFPAAVEDATAVYRWLLSEGYAANNISLGGDSAGGGLTLAALVNLKNLGVPLPQSAILLSPWVDLSGSGESVEFNKKRDSLLTPGALSGFANLYLGPTEKKAPLASPLFADLQGLPPIFIQASSSEILLSDSERLVDNLKRAGVTAHLSIWKNMPHVWQVFSRIVPEGRKAIIELGTFLRRPEQV